MARIKEKRATVHDLARAAGVSLATVDRVLNRRPGVRPATISRVEAAIEALDFRRDMPASLLARARAINVVALLPDGENSFMANLADAIAEEGRRRAADRVSIQACSACGPSTAVRAGRKDRRADPRDLRLCHRRCYRYRRGPPGRRTGGDARRRNRHPCLRHRRIRGAAISSASTISRRDAPPRRCLGGFAAMAPRSG